MIRQWDIGEIREANRRSGEHWFDPGTLRYFSSRIGRDVYQGPGGIFFVTSERDRFQPNRIRAFSVRQFDPETGSVSIVGEFNVHTRSVAHRIARDMAKTC